MRLSTSAAAVFGFTSAVAASVCVDYLPADLVSRDDDPEYGACILSTMKPTPGDKLTSSVILGCWIECQANRFFPYPKNSDWPTVFAESFHPDLKATFNGTEYDYQGWLDLYHSVNVTIGKNFAPFKHGFSSIVAVANSEESLGGFTYATGWEGGHHVLLNQNLNYTDGMFAVVKEVVLDNGFKDRRIIEFRESSNIPNTAPLPPEKPWECNFVGNNDSYVHLSS